MEVNIQVVVVVVTLSTFKTSPCVTSSVGSALKRCVITQLEVLIYTNTV